MDVTNKDNGSTGTVPVSTNDVFTMRFQCGFYQANRK